MPIGVPSAIGTTNNSATATTIVLTLTASVAAGQTIIVCAGHGNVGNTFSFSDSQTNSWTSQGANPNIQQAVTQSSGFAIGAAQITNPLTTSDTITCTYNATVLHRFLGAWQVSGLQTASALDQTHGAQSTALGWDSGATATTTQANELVIGGCTNNGSGAPTSTPGTGYTELWDLTDGGACEFTVVYQIVSATGAYNANGTWSTGTPANNMAVATYIGVDQGAVQSNLPPVRPIAMWP